MLALSLATDLQAEAKQATAKVRRVTGSAQVSATGGGWTALKANQALPQGSIIRTGADSTVDLFLNNSVVRITSDTTMGVDKLIAEHTGAEMAYQTQLNLKNGNILGNVKKLAHASKYEIKTPTGVAGIRGTDFDITVTQGADGKFTLVITSIQGTIVGSAVNSSGNLVTAVINTGESWNPDDNALKTVPLEVINRAKELLAAAQAGGGDQSETLNVPDIQNEVDDSPNGSDL